MKTFCTAQLATFGRPAGCGRAHAPVRRHQTARTGARKLDAGAPLLYRYPPGRDGLPATERAFLPRSFWLVQALAHTGLRREADALFCELLGAQAVRPEAAVLEGPGSLGTG